MSLNVCVFNGNLTRDIVTKQVGDNKVAKFAVAVNRHYKKDGENKKDVVYLDVETWGQQADFLTKFAKKGSSVMVEGRLQQDNWEDKTTGDKRSKIYVVANRVELVGPKSDAGDSSGNLETSDTPPTDAEVPF